MELEPRLVPKAKFLWSPNTSVADNKGVIMALREDAEAARVEVLEGVDYLGAVKDHATYVIFTKDGPIRARHVINTAGAYVDRVAHDFGAALDYCILPFRGIFLMGDPDVEKLNHLVYRLPVSRFLGAHTTNTVDGEVKLGPTAIPALSRQQYSILADTDFKEALELIPQFASLLFSPNRMMWLKQFVAEFRKQNPPAMCKHISQLVTGVTEKQYKTWGATGIHATLFNKLTRDVEQDFIVEEKERTWHFLNPSSPGWTCALAMADDWSDRIIKSIR
jgi:L-2-hydroxyglutarate oxidase LhgO